MNDLDAVRVTCTVNTMNEKTDRMRAMELAYVADADPRTCAKAISDGADAIRTRSVRDRIAFAARRLGIALGTKASTEAG